ncbi:MAG: DEAD/DEAH box helicase [Deltaproteobacteria bacterium]|nr:DEAD/DEAH box helicase [Deltaproteobacteria bacterium]
MLLPFARTRKVQSVVSGLGRLHPVTRAWFQATFGTPTAAQDLAWSALAERESTLLLAPTGSGKTLAAFLTAIDRLCFHPPATRACRVLYVSPLKALGNDIERNLKAPLDGITAHAAALGVAVARPTVGIRSGDTSSTDRARMARQPPDILITTPESLYLILTSEARRILTRVDTLIVDEIHSVLGTKRGAHLAVSVERLEAQRSTTDPLLRVGLSATQRPPEAAARFLGGFDTARDDPKPRPVKIIDVSARKTIELDLEVPVESLRRLGAEPVEGEDSDRSVWPEIHQRLLARIRDHRSTLVFTNNRRLAERLTADLNDLAGEVVAKSHHGSVSREQRFEIESDLKAGKLPCLVATSSLELGIDMGAVDQVILVETPASIASGLQRIGRANHQVGAIPAGALFPKHKTELLAASAAVEAILAGEVEPTTYLSNPLDVLAQQVVAMVAMSPMTADELFVRVRGSAPFAELPWSSFVSVLDMLSGRYPSDELAELRPRVTWDRQAAGHGTLVSRPGSKRLAIVSGGTIPDRGLFGVYLTRPNGQATRIGELDEEMVFESRPGEVFLLGATSWRIDEITPDRVNVSPAPGEPGKMPFWRGEGAGRSVALGRRIGALGRELMSLPRAAAIDRLTARSKLSIEGAELLYESLVEQAGATGGEIPSDQAIVLERFTDEVGDHRVCVLSPFGNRVHAPWATAILARIRQRMTADVTATWSDDGIVFRVPDTDPLPELSWFVPGSDEVEELVTSSLAETSLFAARFRENAARSLLLPRRFPGKRMPLWSQRRKASSLLRVAGRYRGFPVVLETYRECLKDEFDMPALMSLLRDVEAGNVRVVPIEASRPSPFATSLMFSYASSFMYEGDLPLAERQAQLLSLDLVELRKLIGEPELRKLLDPAVLAEVERRVRRLDSPIDGLDGLHDLLIMIGELDLAELEVRGAMGLAHRLVEARRAFWVVINGDQRLAAFEDAARFRDALGVEPPESTPTAFLEAVDAPLDDLISRYARTHGPFTTEGVARHFGIGVAPARDSLMRLVAGRRIQEGAFTPGREGAEWCHVEVLRMLKQRTLATLRAEVQPVSADCYVRFLLGWQGLIRKRRGIAGLRAVIEQLEGVPIPFSDLEAEVLPSRVEGFRPSDLDQLMLSGEVMWTGVERIGGKDGRVSLYLREHFGALAPVREKSSGELVDRIRGHLSTRGASFFGEMASALGGFPPALRDALFDLVFAGEVTNDTLIPLRAMVRGSSPVRARGGLAGAEGRWTLVGASPSTEAERRAALARKLLERYGVLLRETLSREWVDGGFGSLTPVFSAMEDAGRARRGLFVDLPGAGYQVGLAGAEEALRAARNSTEPRLLVLAATDPANPYGNEVPWPEREGFRPQRAAGAKVVLRSGELLGWIGRGDGALLTYFGADAAIDAKDLLLALARAGAPGTQRALKIGTIDGAPAQGSKLQPLLLELGFVSSQKGGVVLRARRVVGR